ncbi:S8 family serine peptidase [Enterobacter cloacae]
MGKEAVIFQSPEFDGNIYIKLTGFKGDIVKNIKKVEYDLVYGTTHHEPIVKDAPYYLAASFSNVPNMADEKYYCTVHVTYLDGRIELFETKKITLKNIKFPEVQRVEQHEVKRFFTTKDNFHAYANAEKYYISILFKKGENGQNKLQKETKLSTYNKIKSKSTLIKAFSDADIRNNSLGKFSELYTIENDNLTTHEMIALTEELRSLSYIEFAVLSPILKENGLSEQSTEEEIHLKKDVQNETPDFEPLQDYLEPTSDKLKGLNIRKAWKHTIGSYSTTRHLDLNGIRQDHEDLEGNITVVTNSANWEASNTHSTGCNGVIAAKKNDYGITGIVHDGNHFSYASNNSANTKLIADILRDSNAGDVISMSIGLVYHDEDFWGDISIPYIESYDFWLCIKEIVEKRKAIFVLAAGNGSFPISDLFKKGFMTDHGDCGVFLAGGCHKETGEWNAPSNSDYHSSHINAWNQYAVTTGRGSLYGEEHAKNAYNKNMGGTSIAAPLAAATVALIQSYAIEKYNIFLNRDQMLALLQATGSADADHTTPHRGKMGHRPDAAEGIAEIERIMKDNGKTHYS